MENHIFFPSNFMLINKKKTQKMLSLLSCCAVCLIHLIEFRSYVLVNESTSSTKPMLYVLMYEQKLQLNRCSSRPAFLFHQLNVFAIFIALFGWSFLSLNSWCHCRAWVEFATKTLAIIEKIPPDWCISISSIVSIVSDTLL